MYLYRLMSLTFNACSVSNQFDFFLSIIVKISPSPFQTHYFFPKHFNIPFLKFKKCNSHPPQATMDTYLYSIQTVFFFIKMLSMPIIKP
jgi:hypothetical protein